MALTAMATVCNPFSPIFFYMSMVLTVSLTLHMSPLSGAPVYSQANLNAVTKYILESISGTGVDVATGNGGF